MAQINSVIIQGNLVRNPDITQLPSGTWLATFAIAVNRSYLKRDGNWHNDVSYFDCEAWAAEAQRCQEEKLQKGSHVKVVGRLQQDRWQDREGKNHHRVKIISEYFEKQAPQTIGNEPKELAAQAESMHRGAHAKGGEEQNYREAATAS